MKDIKIYKITQENGEEYISYTPPVSGVSYMLSHWLIADPNMTLRNKKTSIQVQSVTIPDYRMKDWEEVVISN